MLLEYGVWKSDSKPSTRECQGCGRITCRPETPLNLSRLVELGAPPKPPMYLRGDRKEFRCDEAQDTQPSRQWISVSRMARAEPLCQLWGSDSSHHSHSNGGHPPKRFDPSVAASGPVRTTHGV